MLGYMKTDTYLKVVFDNGESATIYNDHPNFNEAWELFKAGKYEAVRALMAPVQAVTRAAVGYESVTIVNDEVYYLDRPIHNTLTERMVEMIRSGVDIKPMVLFLDNLMQNPSHRAVKELFSFLEYAHLPITDDGCFLAYKRIKENWTDIFSGEIDNSIGATPSMPRNEVDEDKDRTCSSGLHFCSREYLPVYGTGPGNRTIMIKINPRDVVAIPSDYNNTKGRCCEYVVIKELEHRNEEEIERAYYPWNEDEELNWNDEEEEFGPVEDDDEQAVIVSENILSGDKVFWVSVEVAADGLNIPSAYIKRVLKGDRKSTGGYLFYYSD